MRWSPAAVLVGLLCSCALAADFDVRDQAEFRKVIPADARVEKLASGMQFTEGPVWMSERGGYLIFSDVPANKLMKWTAGDGLSVFREDSHNINGNTRDVEGRLVSCEHSARRVSRTEKDGTVQGLAERFDGKRFNSPNDVVVARDGAIYFTDPDYGLPRDQKREQPGNYVYRLDAKTGQVRPVAKDLDKPNGLCFSPDEKKLYIADSGGPKNIRVYDVSAEGSLSGGAVFCTMDKGAPDGIRCDADGRVWSSAGDGIQIFSADGKLIGKVLVAEPPANLCFGGEDGRTLFITARTGLYRVGTAVQGAQRIR